MVYLSLTINLKNSIAIVLILMNTCIHLLLLLFSYSVYFYRAQIKCVNSLTNRNNCQHNKKRNCLICYLYIFIYLDNTFIYLSKIAYISRMFGLRQDFKKYPLNATL